MTKKSRAFYRQMHAVQFMSTALLEKACFLKGLQFLREKRINVVEVITDAHTQIAYFMSKSFFEKEI